MAISAVEMARSLSTFRSVARIGIQVAEALEYANRAGVLHRDIKPSNLLLDHRGTVWVADFGLAKTAEADDLGETGDVPGTLRYVATECFSGQCDARSDVYSLGLTLHELVALRPAYDGSDRHELVDKVLYEEPARIASLAPKVPRDLETIIHKAIAHDPAKRYGTALELADDLGRFDRGEPILARRIGPLQRIWKWSLRHPWQSICATIAVAAAAFILGLTYRHNPRASADSLLVEFARDLAVAHPRRVRRTRAVPLAHSNGGLEQAHPLIIPRYL
jgi:eukaryotic-like serine/threonine-protein kinase